MMSTIFVNIYGAPGAGKTTAAYCLTGLLKKRGIHAEYVREAIKWRIYRNTDHEGRIKQDLLMAEQLDDLLTLNGKVDVVVTDSPLLMQCAYHDEHNSSPSLTKRTIELVNEFDNFNVLLQRTHVYDPRHRYQTEEQAEEKHHQIIKLLDDNNQNYVIVPTHQDVEHDIYYILTDHFCI